jgi:hypothetical protein
VTRRSLLPGFCAAFLLVVGFLPIANWIPGGHEAEWYLASLSEWASGTAIGVGMAVVMVVVLRRFDYWPSAPFSRLAARATSRPGMTAVALAASAMAIYSLVAVHILSARPLLIDEIVQVMQARIFAGGQLTLPAAGHPEFFSALHVVDLGDRVFSQFPPGGPLMLLPGVLLDATWLVGPLAGAAAVVMYWQLARRTETSPSRALGATVLFTAAPFMAFMAGSHMNHVPTLAWLCVALWALHRLTGGAERQEPLALACGLSLGMMTAIRPVDGAAFAIPAGLWMLVRTLRGQMRWGPLLVAGLGVAIPAGCVLAYNEATTGAATLFGYELLWGPSHGLGFHRAPWGVSHSPARGLELVSLMFLRLQTYLFETPVPSLVPAIVALALSRSVNAFDRYLIASSALLVGGYFSYWHDGFFLGPRFAYLLLPVLVTWTVRLPSIVRERFAPAAWADRAVVLGFAVSALVALSVSIPARARQYAGGLSSMRHDYLAPAASAGVEDALILVRESWGSQLIARLWGLGVPRSETEGIYRTVDSCILDEAVSRLERREIRGEAALRALLPLTSDSSRLVRSELSPDRTERVLPGATYGSTCQRRILEDRAGYSFLTPILARAPATNIYARDLHARDTLLLALYPGRRVYLLRTESSGVGAPLVLEPLNVDSARAAWRESSPSSP